MRKILPYGHLKFLRPTDEEAARCREIVTGTAGLVARHLNKRFSLPISLLVARRGVRPNQITAFNMVVGLLSGALAWWGNPSSILGAGFLFQLASILDGVDGEVAKLNRTSSRLGQWLDTLSDNLTLLVFLVGLSLGLYRQGGDPWVLWSGRLSLFSFLVLIGIMLLFLKRNTDSGSFVTYDKEFVSKVVARGGGLAQFVRFGRHFLKKDSFALMFFLLIVLGWPQWVLYLTALGTTLGWMLMAYFNLRRRWESRALELAKGEVNVP